MDHKVVSVGQNEVFRRIADFEFHSEGATHANEMLAAEGEVDQRLLDVWISVVLPVEISRVQSNVRTPRISLQVSDELSVPVVVQDDSIRVQ